MQKELDRSREEHERLSSDFNSLKFDNQRLQTQLLKAEVGTHHMPIMPPIGRPASLSNTCRMYLTYCELLFLTLLLLYPPIHSPSSSSLPPLPSFTYFLLFSFLPSSSLPLSFLPSPSPSLPLLPPFPFSLPSPSPSLLVLPLFPFPFLFASPSPSLQQSSAAASSSQEERACLAEAQSAKLEKERDSLLAEQQSKEKDLQEVRGEERVEMG